MNYQELARHLAPYLAPTDGTWTPTYLGGTTPGSTTYTVQVGRYLLIGNRCLFSLRVDWTAASGTGNAQIYLPFTCVNLGTSIHAVSVYVNNLTFANGSVQGAVIDNTNYMILASPITNAGVTVVQVEAAGTIIASGVYEIA